MPVENNTRGNRKKRIGVVLSAKSLKTIAVLVRRRYRHPLYGKEINSSKKIYAHDEKQAAKPGDKVCIVETRPLSRTKRWRLLSIVEQAAVAGGGEKTP